MSFDGFDDDVFGGLAASTEPAADLVSEALFSAAGSGDVSALDALISAGVGLKVVDGAGRTPVQVAVLAGRAAAAERLLAEGDRVDAGPPLSSGRTVLHVAAERGLDGVVRVLLGRADVDAAAVTTSGQRGRTALHEACANRHVKVVRALLETGTVDPAAAAADGATALHLAVAQHNNALVVAALLADTRVDVNARSGDGRTPLFHACTQQPSQWPTIEKLLAHPAIDPNAVCTGTTALHAMCAASADSAWQVPILRCFTRHPHIDLGARSSRTGEEGWTALHKACAEASRAAMVHLLADGRVDPHALDAAGRAPLAIGVQRGRSHAVIEALLTCPRWRRASDGNTAVAEACDTNAFHLAFQLLHDPGVDPMPVLRAGAVDAIDPTEWECGTAPDRSGRLAPRAAWPPTLASAFDFVLDAAQDGAWQRRRHLVAWRQQSVARVEAAAAAAAASVATAVAAAPTSGSADE